MDTDTLLALLSSLLPEPTPGHETLLDALIRSEGDVEAAAAFISSHKKRKRAVGLDAWLQTPSSSSSKPRSKRVKLSPDKLGRARAASAPPESSSVAKPNALAQLRPPQSEAAKRGPSHFPPLTLSNPVMVSEKTPCTLHPQVLPSGLAAQLFEVMLSEAESWQRNRWWLFERAVESPHKSSFFVRDTHMLSQNTPEPSKDDSNEWREAAHYWTYASQFESRIPSKFPEAMEEACRIIERIVNTQISQRKQFSLEWGEALGAEGSVWQPNVAAANCYSGGKENVGFHSDALTYLGPYPTIASLSLGVSRIFRLRDVVPTTESPERRSRSFDIPLTHNSLLIMHPPTQEIYKHAVIPQKTIDVFHYNSISGESCTSTSRINITFRFFRPDYKPSTIPKCSCGVPTILRPDMKGKRDADGRLDRYWWTCQNGAKVKNEGKGCGMWKEMDAKAEGRGPFITDRDSKGDAEATCSSL